MSAVSDAKAAGRTVDQQRAHEELHGIKRCPNCDELVNGHPDSDCILRVFANIIRDRGNKTEAEIQRLHADCNADALWDRIGPLLNVFEDGYFSQP